MGVRVRFDVDLDGSSFPGPLQGAAANLGDAWVGPRGLLSLLETHLGLPVGAANTRLRTAQLVPRLFRQGTFYSASSTSDPWGTARRLLEWRDALWERGWRGEAYGSPRLAALADVTSGLAPGRPERVAEVTGWLASRTTPVRMLELGEPEAHYSPSWRELFAALRRTGVEVHHASLNTSVSVAPQLIRPYGPRIAARELAATLT